MTYNRKAIAVLLAASKGHPEFAQTFKAMVKAGDLTWTRNYVDNGFRGCGNRALRRSGETVDRSCDCDICVVYGGDCSYQMWKEDHAEWHAQQRGVKTRLSRISA